MLLGVPRDASPEAIRRAYRTHAKRLHPDLAGCDRKMAQLSRVYATLGDPAARGDYDRRLAGATHAAPRRPTRVFHPPARLSADAERFLQATLLPFDRLLSVALLRLEAALAPGEAQPVPDLAGVLAQTVEVLATTGPRLARAAWPAALGASRERYGQALRLVSDALVDLREDLAAGRGVSGEGPRALVAGRAELERAKAAAFLLGG